MVGAMDRAAAAAAVLVLVALGTLVIHVRAGVAEPEPDLAASAVLAFSGGLAVFLAVAYASEANVLRVLMALGKADRILLPAALRP